MAVKGRFYRLSHKQRQRITGRNNSASWVSMRVEAMLINVRHSIARRMAEVSEWFISERDLEASE